MIVGKRSFTKRFEGETAKEAYLSACKWLASNLFSNVELSKRVVTSFVKDLDGESPAIVVEIFVKEEEKGVREEHCKKCKQLYTLLYAVDKPNCTECKARAYQKRLEESVASKSLFVKEVMEDKEQ